MPAGARAHMCTNGHALWTKDWPGGAICYRRYLKQLYCRRFIRWSTWSIVGEVRLNLDSVWDEASWRETRLYTTCFTFEPDARCTPQARCHCWPQARHRPRWPHTRATRGSTSLSSTTSSLPPSVSVSLVHPFPLCLHWCLWMMLNRVRVRFI
jgi:hypothetical protein